MKSQDFGANRLAGIPAGRYYPAGKPDSVLVTEKRMQEINGFANAMEAVLWS